MAVIYTKKSGTVMKILLLFFVFPAFLLKLSAQTDVSGIFYSDTTWSKAKNPYNIVGNIGIPENVTLTIEPGVIVNFTGNYEMLIYGNLKVNGTENDSVYFRTIIQGGSGTKKAMEFRKTNLSNSNINYLHFQGPQDMLLIGRQEDKSLKVSGTLVFDNCTFGNTRIQTDGYNSTGKLLIRNSVLKNMLVWSRPYYAEPVELEDCNVINGTFTSDGTSKGITINESRLWNSKMNLECCGAKIRVLGSKLSNCQLSSNSDNNFFDLRNSILLNTSIQKSKSTYDLGQYLEMTNCIFISNLDKRISYQNLTLSNSTVAGNGWYTAITADGVLNVNSTSFSNWALAVEIEGQATLANCNFMKCISTIKTTGSHSIQAIHNYWDTDDIDESITDRNENLNLGIVEYEPLLQEMSPDAPVTRPVNVFKQNTEGGIIVSWRGNHEPDLAGYKIYFNPIDEFSWGSSVDVGTDTSFTINGMNLSDTIVVTAYDKDADGSDDQIEGHESWYSEPAILHFHSLLISGNTYCSNNMIRYEITPVADFNPDNSFILQLSDTTGSFAEPVILTEVNSTQPFELVAQIPENVNYGMPYQLRVISTSPQFCSELAEVVFYQVPASDFNTSLDTVCGSTSLLLSLAGEKTDSALYEWNFDGATVIDILENEQYLLQWSGSGNRTITLQVDGYGCKSGTHSKTIYTSDTRASFTLDEYVCDNSETRIDFTGSASDSAEYIWDFDGGIIVFDDEFGPTGVKWEEPGWKTVTLTVKDKGCSSMESKLIENRKAPSSELDAPSDICYKGTATISYAGTASDSASYSWDFDSYSTSKGKDAGPYQVNWSDSGLKMINLEINDNGCSTYIRHPLTVGSRPSNLPICLVSVDSTNRNSLVWSLPDDFIGDSVVIFRASKTNPAQYEKVAAVLPEKLVYVDDHSDATNNADSYKIASLDSCGNLSTHSQMHRTMHLDLYPGVNGGWNLMWNKYEGFTVPFYSIYRGNSISNMVKIADIPSYLYTYSDNAPPAGSLFYRIEVEGSFCKPLIGLESYIKSCSNTVSTVATGLANDPARTGILTYPNPAHDVLFIKSTSLNVPYSVKIISFNGTVLFSRKKIATAEEIDVSGLTPGVYFIALTYDNKTIYGKFSKK